MDKIALITGAGSGIGRETALALAAAGYSVVLAGRKEATLRETAERITGPAEVVTVDVTSEESVAALFAAIANRFGRLDLLFNNAGMGTPAIPVADLSLDLWRKVVDTNLTGSFMCAQAAFRMMAAQDPQGGRIINNGSISATTPRPNSIAYTATKHAITGLTKSLSLDGRAYRIACGQIDIGNAETDMTKRMSKGVPQANGTIVAEPTMSAADVAATVVHMASLPLEANVQFITVMATAMPFIGRG